MSQKHPNPHPPEKGGSEHRGLYVITDQTGRVLGICHDRGEVPQKMRRCAEDGGKGPQYSSTLGELHD